MENKKVWFKAKEYGWGWYPSSWQGWAVIGLYTVLVTFHVLGVSKFAKSGTDVVFYFTIPLIVNTIFLIIVCYAKGEKPGWRWGQK
jgi:hypothetical protein